MALPSELASTPPQGIRFTLKSLLAAAGAYCVALAITYWWHAGELFGSQEPEFLTRAFHRPRLVILHVFSPVFAAFCAIGLLSLPAIWRCRDTGRALAHVSLATPALLLPVLPLIGLSGGFLACICVAVTAAVMIGDKRPSLAALVVLVNFVWMLSIVIYMNCVLQFASEL